MERLRERDPMQAGVHDEWLSTLRQDCADRVLPITAEEWKRRSASDLLSTVDGLTAATAKVGGLTLLTRNTSDVERSGVRVLNPFEV